MPSMGPASTASRICDLPEELLQIVLRLVKDTESSDAFWNCLQTCRQWHRIGLGLYRGLDYAIPVTIESDTRRMHVEQEDKDIKLTAFTDFEASPPSQLFLSELKSLTIHVRHARITKSFIQSSKTDFFRALANIFHLTQKLTTFSLRFSDQGWDFPSLDVPAVAQSKLAGLVEALPETVVNLELDTAGTDVPPSENLVKEYSSKHLCHQLNQIIHRLRHLRLRVGHVCKELLEHEFRGCSFPHESQCVYCADGDQDIRDMMRSWNMKTMTVWLPWGQNHGNNTFARASRAMLQPNSQNQPIIFVITQQDLLHPTRQDIANPKTNVYRNFCWTTASNISEEALPNLQYFWCKSVFGRSLARDVRSPCTEHHALICTPRRWFEIGRQMQRSQEPGSTSAHPYIAEWALEHMGCWMQVRYLGSRFPISEGNAPGKPFWKEYHESPVSLPIAISRGQSGLWACLFPKCRSRWNTLVHLRGHHMYAHPEHPNLLCYQGVRPCTFPGCERIGAQGFRDNEEFERHLLGHHLKPCTANLVQMTA